MLETKQFIIKKKLPFDSNYIENFFSNMNLDVLRWAVVNVSETDFIIDAAIVSKNQ